VVKQAGIRNETAENLHPAEKRRQSKTQRWSAGRQAERTQAGAWNGRVAGNEETAEIYNGGGNGR